MNLSEIRARLEKRLAFDVGALEDVVDLLALLEEARGICRLLLAPHWDADRERLQRTMAAALLKKLEG